MKLLSVFYKTMTAQIKTEVYFLFNLEDVGWRKGVIKSAILRSSHSYVHLY